MRRASDEIHTGRAGGGRRSIDSTLRKCEKALEKLRPGTSPHTLTVRRIRAFRIALALIDREMDGTEIPGSEGKEDL